MLSKSDSAPLLEVQLELLAPDIVWKPELGEGGTSKGVRDMIRKWLMSFLEVGQLMKRLDVGEGNYSKELEEDYDVYDSMNQVCVWGGRGPGLNVARTHTHVPCMHTVRGGLSWELA